jgi:hypothetical protein
VATDCWHGRGIRLDLKDGHEDVLPRGLEQADLLAVSPDGRWVVVTSYQENAVLSRRRIE